MKKLLGILFAMLIASSAVHADFITVETNVNMDNFWEKNGKDTQKVLSIGQRIINANGLKQAPITLDRTPRVVNAFALLYNKQIFISNGILPYIDNDDEMAYVLAHELAHAQEAYDGFLKLTSMGIFNSKKYEYKADLKAIDYMVKAGYNPVASICVATKILDEPLWDWGFLSSHPKASKRMLAMYSYIYVKYPGYLNSSMASATTYRNFYNAQLNDIKKFENKYKTRKIKRSEDI